MYYKFLQIFLISSLSLSILFCEEIEDTGNDEVATLAIAESARRNQRPDIIPGTIPEAELDAVHSIEADDWGMDYGVWVMRCSHGQDLIDPDCSGSATEVEYCSSNDNSCNLNDENEPVASGPLYQVCADLNERNEGAGFSGISTWRVPYCPDGTGASCELEELYDYVNDNASKFPGDMSTTFWSAHSSSGTNAYSVDFSDVGSANDEDKTTSNAVHCISFAQSIF